MAPHPRSPRLLPLSLLLLAAAGCNSTIDVTLSRGAVSLHLGDTGCGVSYAGYGIDRAAGPSAIDLTCPKNLRPHGGAPSLHLSTPLVTMPGSLPLRDERFQAPGYQLGQFVVVTYEDGGRSITCDPLQALGAVVYEAIPRGAGERLAGRFSDDAALLNCRVTGTGAPDGNVPLKLSGSFDLLAP